jgi:hypothetical protein
LLAASRTSTCGAACWKAFKRGSSHNAVTPMLALMVTGRRASLGRRLATTSPSCSSIASALRNSRRPSPVNSIERWPRTSSRYPSDASSACTWRLSADCVTHMSRAASVILMRRPTATKLRSRSNGGKSRSRLGMTRM